MKVLVVDDSALMRRYLTDMLSAVVGIHVCTARDGVDALKMIELEDPDVVTLDINMPQMDGLTCLSHIMTRFPRPVVMLSSLTETGALSTFEAMEMGAFDYITKPGGTVSLNIRDIRSQILVKVRAAYRQRHQFSQQQRANALYAKPDLQAKRQLDTQVRGVVCIGVSTGGPSALERILPFLSVDFPLPVLVCQHMPGSFTGVFAERLNNRCPLEVVEINRAMELKAGCIYIALGDADCSLSIRANKPYIVSSPASNEFNWHPSVSRLLQSVQKYLPANRTVSVMLTGMGDDGADEMAQLHRQGGITLAQRERDCAVFGMPKALIERSGASQVLALHDMPAAITQAAEQIAKLGAIASWA